MDRDAGFGTEARPPPDSGTVASHADRLLASKLFVPPLASTMLDRPRLVTRLAEGLRRPLTLIAAPPGWGKTTLLSAWAISGAADATVLAWLSLDPRDNDPARFWAYIVLALRQIQPGVGETSLAILRSPRPAPPESYLTPLLNDLAAMARDAVLVLEDYHAIVAAVIHQGLTFLLDHLPPQLHLFITTRPIRPFRWHACERVAPSSNCARTTSASPASKRGSF